LGGYCHPRERGTKRHYLPDAVSESSFVGRGFIRRRQIATQTFFSPQIVKKVDFFIKYSLLSAEKNRILNVWTLD
jgi:hypothetical protein